jgi:hypothetical protein
VSHDAKFGEVGSVAFGIESHEPIGAKQRMGGDNAVDQEPLWRISCGKTSPLRIGCKAFRSLPPDGFLKVRVNDDTRFRHKIFYKVLGCFGMRKQFREDWGARPRRLRISCGTVIWPLLLIVLEFFIFTLAP